MQTFILVASFMIGGENESITRQFRTESDCTSFLYTLIHADVDRDWSFGLCMTMDEYRQFDWRLLQRGEP